MASISDILETLRSYSPDANVQPVMSAYLLAAKAHAGQTRKSGEPYLTHPLAVAAILADMRMDIETIATALLHDALEDNPITKEEMEAEVGPVITELVDGVTKIGKLRFRSKEELQAENFRKMMLAMHRDLRVILVKLADRLHNMSTLEHHDPKKRAIIAQETLDIYVPIANRLGLTRIKAQLEDYCFRYLHEEEYARIVAHLEAQRTDLDAYIRKVCTVLGDVLREHGVEGDVSGRVKAPYSIFKKLQRGGYEKLEDLRDLIAFRILVADPPTCYAVLGMVHASFEPLPDTFKDYIARPKPNGYQSLHTVVIGPENRRVEIQIRTHAMHEIAEKGIAAHWKYKEGRLALSPEEVVEISRIREVFEEALQAEDASDFREVVKSELYADEVFVFTPAGDLKRFPLGATALDFAYAIHTDVGNTCVGAKVDGRMVPLRYELKSGDRVEILTSSTQRPSRDWLEFAKTGRAVSKIRRFLRLHEREAAIKLGRDLLEAELKKYGDSLQKAKAEKRLEPALERYAYKDTDVLFENLGRGNVSPASVARRIVPEALRKKSQGAGYAGITSVINRFRGRTQSPVLISGEDNVLVHFAQCCNPLPGEQVVGFITRGRGITVHKVGCEQLASLDEDRRIPVEWDADASARHTGKIRVTCRDRPGLLANISSVCEKAGVNINAAEARNLGDGHAVCQFEVSIRDVGELGRLMKNIEKIAGVESVDRVGG